MMKKSMLLTLVSLMSLLLTACSNTPAVAQIDEDKSDPLYVTTSIVTVPTDTVNSLPRFPVEIVEPMIEQSFSTMASEYKMYAHYFNICQKSPNDAVCGSPYKTAMSRYKRAKANDDVLNLLWGSELINTPLPAVANNDLATSLVALGYLDADNNGKFSRDEINQAGYVWMHDKGLPKADSILLLHHILLTSEVLKLNVQES